MAISVASALVSSRLDHVNSILYGAASKHTIIFSVFRKHWLELLCISAHMALHSHPLHYSKTFIGYLLNGIYASNWPPWRIRHYTLASHLTLLNCFDAMNPCELCNLPLLFCSLSHGAILSLARVLSESLHQRFGTHSLPIFAILHHSLLFVGISKHTFFC